MNTTSLYLLKLLRGFSPSHKRLLFFFSIGNKNLTIVANYSSDGSESADDEVRPFVDVRDVADAILLVYKRTEAEGRYICSSHEIGIRDLVEKLKGFYPNYNYPRSFNEVETELRPSSEKLQKLGWRYRPLEETLVDAVNNYEESGPLVK